MYSILITSIFIIIQGRNNVADKNDDYAERLMQDLTSNYGVPIRPFQDASIPSNITIMVILRKVLKIEQKNQILHTNFWLIIKWNDYKLQWNNSEYGGIKTFKIPYKKIWTPDIMLLNNVNPTSESITQSLATVKNTGMVSWSQGGVLRSSCMFDLTYFPFDVQTCHLIWASLSYDIQELDLFINYDKRKNSSWEENDEYEILGCNLTKTISFARFNKFVQPNIICTIKLRRKSLTYVFNFILPCSLISATGLLVFYVPCLSGEKVTLGISALLSMTVFLLKITNTLPATENVTILSLYYVSSMCLVTFATGLSVLNLNVYHQGERRTSIPKTVKFILNIISGLICIPQWSSLVKNHAGGNFTNHANSIGDMFINQRGPPVIIPNRGLNVVNFHETDKQKLLSIILQYDDVVNYQERLAKEEERNIKLKDEWRHASVVLDRCFLVTFVLIGSIATIIILFSSYTNFK